MQAILTKYHGPTNTKGSRISAECEVKKIFCPYNHALDIQENHCAAAKELASRLNWLADAFLVTGTLPNNDRCHVFVPVDID